MATNFTLRDVFDTDVDTYWDRIFFDAEYNERIYREALGFKSFTILEQTGEPGQVRTRTMRTEPAADAPAVVRKMIGDSFSYTERGTFDPSTKIWTYSITTSGMPEKIKIGGRLWAEPQGDRKCVRVAEIGIEVKIFGVGSAIEKFIEKTTRDSYVKATAFTNRFIAEKGV